jgi:hypothetical protein
LASKFREKPYRDSYVSSHVKRFLANQIVAFQGEKSQEEFGRFIGKPQSVVSRLQNPKYGKYTLQTLLDIASKLDVAFVARFVDFPTFLKFTNDFSDRAICPAPYIHKPIDPIAQEPSLGGLYYIPTTGIAAPNVGATSSGFAIGTGGLQIGGIAANDH